MILLKCFMKYINGLFYINIIFNTKINERESFEEKQEKTEEVECNAAEGESNFEYEKKDNYPGIVEVEYNAVEGESNFESSKDAKKPEEENNLKSSKEAIEIITIIKDIINKIIKNKNSHYDFEDNKLKVENEIKISLIFNSIPLDMYINNNKERPYYNIEIKEDKTRHNNQDQFHENQLSFIAEFKKNIIDEFLRFEKQGECLFISIKKEKNAINMLDEIGNEVHQKKMSEYKIYSENIDVKNTNNNKKYFYLGKLIRDTNEVPLKTLMNLLSKNSNITSQEKRICIFILENIIPRNLLITIWEKSKNNSELFLDNMITELTILKEDISSFYSNENKPLEYYNITIVRKLHDSLVQFLKTYTFVLIPSLNNGGEKIELLGASKKLELYENKLKKNNRKISEAIPRTERLLPEGQKVHTNYEIEEGIEDLLGGNKKYNDSEEIIDYPDDPDNSNKEYYYLPVVIIIFIISIVIYFCFEEQEPDLQKRDTKDSFDNIQ